MLVKDRMTPQPITIAPDASVAEAFRLIRENKVSYLPVIDKKDKLVGIVTQMDLQRASPSLATTLSIFEANYLLANLKVREVMSSPPITVSEETPIEEAAWVMVKHEIGCLPVMRGEQVVGVITETDIFKAFVQILGGGQAVLRITLRAPDVPGELAHMTGLIAHLGGNLCAVVSFRDGDPGYVYFTFRLEGVSEDVLIPALKEMGAEIVHVCRAD
ncbi:MAG: CBS domain-containing protein [Thermoflexales bacterium]|nr:CBS domain-containing protein [Thermoflexales bacterium]